MQPGERIEHRNLVDASRALHDAIHLLQQHDVGPRVANHRRDPVERRRLRGVGARVNVVDENTERTLGGRRDVVRATVASNAGDEQQREREDASHDLDRD